MYICDPMCPTLQMYICAPMCSNVPHFTNIPHFYKYIFLPKCAPLHNFYKCINLSQVKFPELLKSSFNVPNFLNVPNFYKCIFVPQCAPLLQMYICAPMCPNVPHFCIFVYEPHPLTLGAFSNK